MPADEGGTDNGPPTRSGPAGTRLMACPRCGQGPLYDGLLALAEHCTVCGLDYGTLVADDGAAFFLIVGVSALVIPAALGLEFALEPPYWLHVAIWPVVVIGGIIALMRPLKAWLIRQHYRHVEIRKDHKAERPEEP